MNFAYLAAAMMSLAAPSGSLRPNQPAHDNESVLLDFRADWCGPCRQMDSVVSGILAEGYPVRRVNVDQERELANRFGVQGIPCFVMLVDGHEVDRTVGVTDRGRLEAMFSRNGVGPSVNATRAQSPGMNAAAAAVPFPTTDKDGSFRSGVDLRPHHSQTDNVGVSEENVSRPDSDGEHYDRLQRASVRLRIEDENGYSRGSGTIIDARSGEALIITCGHMFRDAAKDGRIWVDLFGPSAPQGVPGRLIDFDMKSEVGLIRIATNYPVTVAHLAPPGYVARTGDRMISMGCDGGADVTAKDTHVTSINRYVGSPNLQVAFQPVQGRSGGGLFTPEGWVVGVCYAADPEANEGLFTALPALCVELDHVGLSFVYREGKGQELAARVPETAAAMQWSTIGEQKSADGGLMADRQVRPAAMTTTALSDHKTEQLTADEAATLQILRDEAQDAEVVCIVRPKGAPQTMSQIIVMNHAAPGFMQQLTAEQQVARRQSAVPAMQR
ncbi:MAG TPA: thioredoxin domain-containing protein [Pirellulales bacterium]